MQQLQAFSSQPLVKSSLWQTSPVDCPPGSPPFVNAVVGLVAGARETPKSLLVKLQAMEKEFGASQRKFSMNRAASTLI
ncbi:MAG: 2-amino-4-hydroxy-6-hydroxymethyldihydropteridine diphosphokinase [Verrucomicrobiota bacterium]